MPAKQIPWLSVMAIRLCVWQLGFPTIIITPKKNTAIPKFFQYDTTHSYSLLLTHADTSRDTKY